LPGRKNDFTCETAGKQLTFEVGSTQVVEGTLTLNGQAEGTEIVLGSDSPGIRFNLQVASPQTVYFVDVSDSEVTGTEGNDITANSSVNSGNNDEEEASPHWIFITGINVSGTLYVDEEGTKYSGDELTLALYLNQVLADATTTADGDFSFANIMTNPDDALLLFIDGSGDYDANLLSVVVDSETNIEGISMYTGKIVLSHETAGPMTNSVLASAWIDDTDVFYTMSGLNAAFDAGLELRIPAGKTYTPGGEVTAGDIDINGTFNPADNAVTVSGDWDATGGTVTTSGTITFDGTGESLIKGSTTFYDFTCETPGKQLTFEAGSTQTVQGSLTITGTLSNLIRLRSTTSGVQWYLDLATPQSVSYVNVRDSNAGTEGVDPSVTADRSIGGTSSYNNQNWIFIDPLVLYWVGEVSSDWNIAGNWSLASGGAGGAGVPGVSWLAKFDAASDADCYLSADVEIEAIELFGYTGTLTTEAYNLTIDSDVNLQSGTIDASLCPEVKIGGNWVNSGGEFIFGEGQVNFNAPFGIAQTLDSGGTGYGCTFNNLVHSGEGTLSLSGNGLKIADSFTNQAGVFDTNDLDVYIGGHWTNQATFISGTGTVYLTRESEGTQVIISGGSPFYNLDYSSAALRLGSALQVTGTLTSSLSALDLNGYDLDLTGATFSNEGTMKLKGNETLTGFTNNIGAGTVEYYGSGTYTGLTAGDDYYNLVISGTGTFTALSDLDINGNFILRSGSGTFNAPSVMNVAGNFDHKGGTFVHNSGEVIFDDTNKASIIYGETTFNDFTCTEGGKTLVFEKEKTQTIQGTLNLTKTSGGLIKLLSTEEGAWWYISLAGIQDVSYVSVKDSNSDTQINASNSLDRGHNVNWNFTDQPILYWTGTTPSWNNADNWSLISGGGGGAGVPGEGWFAIFDSGSSQACDLDAPVAIEMLTISGYAGTLTTGSYAFAADSDVTIESGTVEAGSCSDFRVGGDFTLSGTGTFNAPAGNMHVGGSFNRAAGAAFTHNSGTMHFDGTLPGKTIVTDGTELGHVRFNGEGGSWTLQDDLTCQSLKVLVGGDIDNEISTLIDNGNTVTVYGDIIIADDSESPSSDEYFLPYALKSTGKWIQADDGDLSNPNLFGVRAYHGFWVCNRFHALEIANDVTSTKVGNAYRGTVTRKLIMKENSTLTGAPAMLIVPILPSEPYDEYLFTDFIDMASSAQIFTPGYAVQVSPYSPSSGRCTYHQKELTIDGKFTICQGISTIVMTGNWETKGDFLFYGHYSADTEEEAQILDTNGYDLTVGGNLSLAMGHPSLQYQNGYYAKILFKNGTHTVGGDISIAGNIYPTQGWFDLGSSTINVGGDIDFTGAIVDAGSAEINLEGNWVNSGTFTAGDSAVIFVGAGGSNIFGNTTFYDLTCETPGKQLTFEAGSTQVVEGTLTLTGEITDRVILRSSEDGTPWNINASGSDVLYADVKDSDASTGPAIIATTSIDRGNNLNWVFEAPLIIWTGAGADGNWTTALNWITETAPGADSTVLFDGVSGLDPNKDSTIDGSFGGTVAFLIMDGYTGTITQDTDLAVTGDYVQTSGTFISDPAQAFSVGGSFSIPDAADSFNRYTGGGTDPDTDPYVIYDVYGLQAMKCDLDAHYILNNDIPAGVTLNWNDGMGFEPVGISSDFIGTLDGQDHIITGLFIDRPDEDYVGMFSYTGNGSEISNVGLAGVDITGHNCVGGLAGVNSNGSIAACSAAGNVNATGDCVGGLVGANAGGSIIDSCATVAVDGNGLYIGGLVGTNANGSIEASHAAGSVSGSGSHSPYVGGLVGYNSFGSITGCYATASVSGNDSYVGGLVGGNRGTVENSYATGNVNGDTGIGGLVGFNYENSTIQNSYATGEVSGDLSVGGLVGLNHGLISDSYAVGSVNGTGEVGGFVGKNYTEDGIIIINNCYASGNVEGDLYVGGFVGYNYAGTGTADITDCYAVGSVTGTTDVGGFAGHDDGAIYDNCWWIANGATSGVGNVDPDPAGVFEEPLGAKAFKVYDHSHPVYWVDGDPEGAPAWNFDVAGDGTIGVWIMAGYPHLQMEHSLVITNVIELQLMEIDLSAEYTIANDIDASETAEWNYVPAGDHYTGFTPIGKDIYGGTFKGSLEGAGYTITGLYINRPDPSIHREEGVGLIGCFDNLGGSSHISNLGLIDVDITGRGEYTGEGPESVDYDWGDGGLVGINGGGTITNCYVTGNVTAGDGAGGLVGWNINGIITNCHAVVNVQGGDYFIGGLVGRIGWSGVGGSVTHSYAKGSVSGNYCVGGLVGYVMDTSAVSNSYFTGNVSGDVHVGGLVGYNFASYGGAITVDNCYATGSVIGNEFVGGLAGTSWAVDGTISVANCYSACDVTGEIDAGGFTGHDTGSSYVSNYWMKTDFHNAGLDDTGNDGDREGITSRSDVRMKQQATFEGWDFTGTWTIDEDTSYPYFMDQASLYTEWTWDGDGDGTSWEDPLNWDKDSGYPDDIYDKVLIDTGGAIITTPFGDGLAIAKLTLGENFSGTVQCSDSFTLDNVSGVFGVTISSPDAALDISGSDFTLNGFFINEGTFRLHGDEVLTGFTNDMDSGKVDYYGTGSYPGLLAGDAYYDLEISGGGTYTLDEALDVNGDLRISSGTLDVSTDNHAVNIGGSFVNSGDFNAREGLVTFDGASQGNIIQSGGSSFFFLTINGWGGWIQVGDLDVVYDFNIYTGNFTSSPLNAFTVGHSFNIGNLTIGGLAGDVIVIATAPSGDMYVGGSFTGTLGSMNPLYQEITGLNNIAMWDGSRWNSLAGGLDGPVFAITVDGDDVYVGGDFEATFGGGTSLNHIARWDGSSWGALGGGLDGTVYSIAASGTDIYAGGIFATPFTNIARWDGANWNALGAGLNGLVVSVAMDSASNVYAGGLFTATGDDATALNYIGMWDGLAWNALGSGLNNFVSSVAVDGDDNVYAGGNFTATGGDATALNYIGMWDGLAWNALEEGLSGEKILALDAVWVTVTVDDVTGNIYAGGSFKATADGETVLYGTGMWDGLSWHALGEGLLAEDVETDAVRSIVIDGSGNIYAGGEFLQNSSEVIFNNLAKWDGTSWSTFVNPAFSRFTGSGTEGDPYLIHDVYGLQAMKCYSGRHFALNNDINAAGIEEWNGSHGLDPIGSDEVELANASTVYDVFTGTLDGNNNMITNLLIDTGHDFAGLFGRTSGGAELKNIELESCVIAGDDYVGTLVGQNRGAISNVHVTAGANGRVTGHQYVGGLVGMNGEYIEGSNDIPGGNISGSSAGCIVEAVDNNDYVGGLVGYNIFSGEHVEGVYTITNVISNSYADAAVSGAGYVGGLVGMNFLARDIGEELAGTSITNCHAGGTVTGFESYIGGLVGLNETGGTIAYSYATGDITGGAVGCTGGFVGLNKGTIWRCYATGSVSGGYQGSGGFAGVSFSGTFSEPAVISQCYSTGEVEGDEWTGGFVGYAYNSEISDCYSNGDVTGSDMVGGFVGYYDTPESGEISGCYSSGLVTGGTNVGGFMGYFEDFATPPTSNYWLRDTGYNETLYAIGNIPGDLSAGYVDPRSDIQMKQQATFVGWNFKGVWTIDEGVDYPRLLYEVIYIWSGVAGDGDWTTPENWSVNLIPPLDYPDDAADRALIDATSDLITTPAELELGGLYLGTGYDGTLFLEGDLAIYGDYIQVGGTLFCPDPLACAFTVGESFSLEGGTFHRFTGSGISEDPYMIYDVYGLQAMKCYPAAHFGLNNDIDASSTSAWNPEDPGCLGFDPVGSYPTYGFSGALEGNGHVITDIFIDRTTENNIGLFGWLADGAAISGVGLEGGSVTGFEHVGGLAGYCAASLGGAISISDSYTACEVSGNMFVGGLIGFSNVSTSAGSNLFIDNCRAHGTVTGGVKTGGLIGFSQTFSDSSTTITDSCATGDVNGNEAVGGLIGAVESAYGISSVTITGSHASGSVTGTGGSVGGLVGSVSARAGFASVAISDSYSTGDVEGVSNFVGGLIGRLVADGVILEVGDYNASVAVERCFADCAVSGGAPLFTGGLIGGSYIYEDPDDATVSVSESYAAAPITSESGGFVGYNGGNCSYSDCFWDYEAADLPEAQDSSSGDVDGITGKTTCEMRQEATFTGSGWDFSNDGAGIYGDWIMAGYPRLTIEYSTAITSVYQLQMMALDLAADYILANDIDASGTVQWNCDGTSYLGFDPVGEDGNPFTGTFDGAGHVITGLRISRSTESDVGLFGYAGGATITDVALENVGISGDLDVGALVGHSCLGTVVTDSCVSGGEIGGASLIGGLVGFNESGGVIENSYAIIDVTGNSIVGGLVGRNHESSIANSYAAGYVRGSPAGGLVGINAAGTITDSYATGDVTGSWATSSYVGGLVGANIAEGLINNSYATGSVTVTFTGGYAGGLVGFASIGTIMNAYATGNISDESGTGTIGGLVGGQDGSGPEYLYDNCWWIQNGAVTGVGSEDPDPAGVSEEPLGTRAFKIFDHSHPVYWEDGIVGVTPAWDFDIPGDWILTGYPHLQMEWSETITSVYELQMMALGLDADYTLANNIDASETAGWNWTGSGDDYFGFKPVGDDITPFGGTFDGGDHIVDGLTIDRPDEDCIGLFGYAGADSEIRNVGIHNADVTGGQVLGVLVGANAGLIEDSFATGSLTGISTAPQPAMIGGLVGQNCSNGSLISRSFANVDVNAADYLFVGGLVGYNGNVDDVQQARIEDCYAKGDVNGNQYVGGLVGYNNASLIENAYASGAVSGTPGLAGGLVGLADNGGTTTNSYWDIETTDQLTSAGGEGKTTAEMKQQATFDDDDDIDDWDFDTVWKIVENGTYPYFRWQGLIFGTVYTDCTGTNVLGDANIVLAVNGSRYDDCDTDVAGQYYFFTSSGIERNDTILVYINDNVLDGNTLTVIGDWDVEDLDICGDSVIVRSEMGSVMGAHDFLRAYVAGSGDMLYEVTVGVDGILDVNGSFIIWDSHAFNGSTDMNVGGSWINNGVFFHDNGTVTLDSLVGGDILSGGSSFYNLTVDSEGEDSFYMLMDPLVVEGDFVLYGCKDFNTDSYNMAVGSYSQTGGRLTNTGAEMTCNGDFSVTGGSYTGLPGSTLILDATAKVDNDLLFDAGGDTGEPVYFHNIIFRNSSDDDDKTVTLGSGTFLFTGDFCLSAAGSKGITVNAADNSPDIFIMGNIGTPDAPGGGGDPGELILNGGFENGEDFSPWEIFMGVGVWMTLECVGAPLDGLAHSGDWVGLSVNGNNPSGLMQQFDPSTISGLTFYTYNYMEPSPTIMVFVQTGPNVETDWALLDTIQGTGDLPQGPLPRGETPYNEHVYTDFAAYGDIQGLIFMATNETGYLIFDDVSMTGGGGGGGGTGERSISAGGGTWTISGDADFSDITFNADESTVVFDDNTKPSHISGSTEFHDLTCTTPGKELIFGAGTTQTIGGTLTLDGQAEGTEIVLGSDSPGTRFNLQVSSAQTVSYVNVSDSEALVCSIAAEHSIDSGNNDNTGPAPHWLFGVGISGTIYIDELTTVDEGITVWVHAHDGESIVYSDSTLTGEGGTFSFEDIIVDAGYRVLILLDDAALEANLVTLPADAASAIDDIIMYTNRITLRNEAESAVTNERLYSFNGLFGDDNVHFSVVEIPPEFPGPPSTYNATFEDGLDLWIPEGFNYTPEGEIIFEGGLLNEGAFNLGGSPVTFNGSGSFDIATAGYHFWDITFDNENGEWTLENAVILEGTFMLDQGTFNSGANEIIMTDSYSQTGGTFNAGSSDIYCHGAFSGTGGTFDGGTSRLFLEAFGGPFAFDAAEGYTFHDVYFRGDGGTITLGGESFTFTGGFYMDPQGPGGITVDAAGVTDITILGDIGSAGQEAQNRLVNPGFEEDPLVLFGWVASGGMMVFGPDTFPPLTAYEGDYAAIFHLAVGAGTALIEQQFDSSTVPELRFRLFTLPDLISENFELHVWVKSAPTPENPDGWYDHATITEIPINTWDPEQVYDITGYNNDIQGVRFEALDPDATSIFLMDVVSMVGTQNTDIPRTINAGAGLWQIGGNVDLTGITFNPGTSTVELIAQEAGKTIATGGADFHDLTFNGMGGQWTLQDTPGMINNDLAIMTGSMLHTGGHAINITNDFVNTGGAIVNLEADGDIVLDIGNDYVQEGISVAAAYGLIDIDADGKVTLCDDSQIGSDGGEVEIDAGIRMILSDSSAIHGVMVDINTGENFTMQDSTVIGSMQDTIAVDVNAGGGVRLTQIRSGGTVNIESGKAIYDTNGGANNIRADSLVITAADGICTTAGLETRVSSIRVTNTTNGGITIHNTDRDSDPDTPTVIQGLLNDDDGGQDAGNSIIFTNTGGNLSVEGDVTNNDSGAIEITNDNDDLAITATVESPGGTVTINTGDDYTQSGDSLVSSGILVDIDAGDALALQDNAQITGASSDLYADRLMQMLDSSTIDTITVNIETGANFTMQDSSVIGGDGNTDTVEIDAGGGVRLTRIRSNDTVDIGSGKAIYDANGAANNIRAESLVLMAADGICSGAGLETRVTNIQATNTTNGGIAINNTDRDSDPDTPTVIQGLLNDDDGGQDAGNSIIFTNTGGNLSVEGDVLNYDSGAIEITNDNDDLAITATVESSGGTVTINTGDDYTQSGDGLVLADGLIDIDAGDALLLQDSAQIAGGSADIFAGRLMQMLDSSSIEVGAVAIETGSNFTMQDSSVIGGDGNTDTVEIDAGGGVRLTQIRSNGTVDIESEKAIYDTNGAANNILADSLVIVAADGICSVAGLDTEVSNFAALNTTSNDIYIKNTGGLFVETVGAISGVTNNAGAVNIESDTITVNGNVSATDGDLTLNSEGAIDQNEGTTLTAAGSGSVALASSGESAIGDITSANDLNFNNSGAPTIYNINSTIDIEGDVIINAGVTVNANDSDWFVGRNWTNGGVFNGGTSTVELDTFQDAVISGNSDFFNFTCNAANKELAFQEDSIQVVAGDLIIKGAEGAAPGDDPQLIDLISLTEDSQWHIDPQGDIDIEYVYVQDSVNDNGVYIDPPFSTDGGNNIFWFAPAEGEGEVPAWEDSSDYYLIIPLYEIEVEEVKGIGVALGDDMSGLTAIEIGFDLVRLDDEREKKKLYEDWYVPAKYGTKVRVIKGEAIVAPYGSAGPRYEEGVRLTDGQEIEHEAIIKARIRVFPYKKKTHEDDRLSERQRIKPGTVYESAH